MGYEFGTISDLVRKRYEKGKNFRYEFGTKKCILVNVDKGGRKRYDFFSTWYEKGTKLVRNVREMVRKGYDRKMGKFSFGTKKVRKRYDFDP
jgi:hypothetical protein